MNFKDLGLSTELIKAVEEVGYGEPTPIQQKAIPLILKGQDVLGSAQTGTGKTAAFLLPILHLLSTGRSRARMPRAVILVPTRELAIQVGDNFKNYARHCKLSSLFLIGGTSLADQERDLNRGADLLIATPGRLLDLIGRGKVLLNDIKILVVDEADRMLDMGFIPEVDKIVAMLPTSRQTILFSATMAPAIRKLAESYLKSPCEISVSPPATTATTISQSWVEANPRNKKTLLYKILKTQAPLKAVVFCNQKRHIQSLVSFLKGEGLSAEGMHGDMSQEKRNEVLQAFRAEEIKVLVASDVVARGVHIEDVSLVVNFDIPQQAEDYVHRIGRTGRAGRLGKAISLIMSSDEDSIKEINKVTHQNLQPVSLSLFFKNEGINGEDLEEPGISLQESPQGETETCVSQKGKKTRSQKEKNNPSSHSSSKKELKVIQESQVVDSYPVTKRPSLDRSSERKSHKDSYVIVGFGDHIPAFLAKPLPEALLKRASRS